ncbi:oligosaccharide repeat unit polymerase [Escherichia coli]|uniref:oligosaccharide repeat unit polymerase n=1 Tax=Escherichia coli TaxID=562 RepID=UPI00092D8C3E|nr:oligosaccharide repeat unit polymerase [Escherichia coli]APK16089.1 hypothetical protein RG37_12775 [Escherichia coli]APK39658.1 hypothetical protein RG42_13590 [Escherichia coli]MCV5903643.1 oligosaccharide repeat unit polymerase [Escherichia coli]MCV6064935.1 oligosaccharide repeat unit polymerase [Escherichia coli]HAX7073647.1 oligosaccharide repeat unit polymerase [Escherichia coli]
MTRKYLAVLFAFFNISCAFYFGMLNSLGGDFKYEFTADVSLLLLSTIIALLTFFFIQVVVFSFFEKIRMDKKILYNNNISLDFIIIIITSFAIFFSLYYKVGVLGINKDIIEDAPKMVFYFNSIFQPSYLVLVYLFYRYDSVRLIYYANFILYILLLLVSGQTGQLLILFCLYIMRKRNNFNLLRLFVLSLMGISFYPIIRIFKDAVVQSVNGNESLVGALVSVYSNLDSELYFRYLFITLERFQIVSNIHYIIENGRVLYSGFLHTGSSDTFFSLYWIFSAISKLLGYHTAHIISAQDFMAININGIPTWSSQIGVLGYFYFYQVYAVLIIMFMFFILFISITLSKYLSRNKEIINLTWFLSLMLLCHGWFIPFINYVQCLAVFVALISILKTRTQKFVRN